MEKNKSKLIRLAVKPLYGEFIFNLRGLSSLLWPQNAYTANECSLSDSFLDLLEGLINSYLVFSFFISPFTIFLRHAHCNQVYMPYLMTKRMFTTISTQLGYTKGKSHENVMAISSVQVLWSGYFIC